MSKFDVAIIYGQLIGVTSTIFMAYVFLQESIFNRGVLFFEPNRALAFGEMVAGAIGSFFLAFTMVSLVIGIRSNSKPATDADDNDTMPEPGEAPERLWA